MRLVPDPDTFAVLPWRSDGEDGSAAARIICDIVTTEGEPFEGGPRQVLKRVLSRPTDDMGYTVSIGPEPEFFLFKTDDDGNATTIPDNGGYFDLAPKDLASDVRKERSSSR